MAKMVSMRCPECNANLSIEKGREQCFCQYCGTKIMVDDESIVHTYKKVDVARIKEAEVNETIKLKELLLKEKKEEAKEKTKEIKMKLSIKLGTVGFIFLAIGLLSGVEAFGLIGLAALCIIAYMWMLSSN